jgi:NitT/TauT family transport system permease protein
MTSTPEAQRTARAVRHAGAPVLGSVLLLGLWEGLVRLFDIPAYQLVRPTRAIRTVLDDPMFFWRLSVPTITEAATGLAVAVALAVVLGGVIAQSTFLERVLSPLFTLLQVTPIVAYAPTIVIFVGPGLRSIVFVVVVVCIVPLVTATVSGMRSIDAAALDVFGSVAASRWEILWRLRVPAALPQFFSALRVSVGLALIGAVLGEWSALVTTGLGVRLRAATDLIYRDRLWGVVLVLALIGLVGVGLVRLLESVVLRGRPRHR